MNAEGDIRSIGRPLTSARVAIIDDFGNIAPTFVRGEICIGGSHLFSGYQGREDLTKWAHVVDEKYGRLYKTGDVGFFDAAGNIIFCGRRDTQTKLNGQRLEPEGIASIISEMAYIESSAVAVIKERLAAFLVYGTPGGETASTTSIVPYKREDMDKLQKHVRGRVPSAWVPSIWLRISRVPLTVSGKLDMRKLASLVEATPTDPGDAYVGPEDEDEQRILDCCLQVLGASVCATANLLDHGLDSYLAMVLVSRLRSAFPTLQLSFRDLMANPMPRRLAAMVRQQSVADNTPDAYISDKIRATVKASPRHSASSMQKRFCLAQDVFQDATYNVPGLFEVQDVGTERVRAVLDAIIAEHAIFRTRFEFSPSEGYQQVVMDELQINVAEYDLSSIDGPTA
jgi:aryl carrier-like protein